MSLRVVPPAYEDGDPGPSIPAEMAEPVQRRIGATLKGGADQDVAEEVIAALTRKHGTAPVFDEDQLWSYDGGVWSILSDVEVRNLVCSWNGAVIVGEDGNPKVRKDGSEVTFAGNQTKATAALARTKDLCSRPGFFQQPTYGVMFEDAFVSVTEAGEVVKSAPMPEHRARFRIAAKYPENPRALPDDFLAVMLRAFGGEEDSFAKVTVIQEWFGLSLIGRSPFSKALVLVGPERSGKSVTAKIGLGVFPDSAKTAMSIKSLDPSGVNTTTAQYFLAQIAQSRINADLDMPGGMFVGGENFKKIVTGEGMQGRHPMGRPFPFTPRVSMLFACESLPTPEDKNRGFFRRWLVIRYNNQVDTSDVVENYEARVLEKERGQIAAWFIEGASAAMKRGRFVIPPSADSEIARWIRDSDPVEQFCSIYCSPDPSIPRDKWRPSSFFYDKFKVWCGDYGYGTRNITTFSRDLRRVFLPEYGYQDRTKTMRWAYKYSTTESSMDSAGKEWR